jgi:hypothetical protein
MTGTRHNAQRAVRRRTRVQKNGAGDLFLHHVQPSIAWEQILDETEKIRTLLTWEASTKWVASTRRDASTTWVAPTTSTPVEQNPNPRIRPQRRPIGQCPQQVASTLHLRTFRVDLTTSLLERPGYGLPQSWAARIK